MEKDENSKEDKHKSKSLSTCILWGVIIIGLPLGIVMHNIGVGIPLGALAGMVYHSFLSSNDKDNNTSK